MVITYNKKENITADGKEIFIVYVIVVKMDGGCLEDKPLFFCKDLVVKFLCRY
ncbi:hypothetical protein [Tepidibacter hydrothermalis]|uniref:Uncharacterized protein n=1 Tax=Tepidibacter hydrothermalis TaxID=3036126 RepID=A0ABY8EH50_9FIRM|nr:hypothetical protein [Tepidibacter hydrothermalis]WFD11099.1 hypothetical protein P4S50_03215 [Tepidibacter hydrothermalis]